MMGLATKYVEGGDSKRKGGSKTEFDPSDPTTKYRLKPTCVIGTARNDHIRELLRLYQQQKVQSEK